MISIHRPYPDKEKLVIDSMHMYREAARQQKGLVSVHTLEDQSTGDLFGVAIWGHAGLVLSRPASAEEGDGEG